MLLLFFSFYLICFVVRTGIEPINYHITTQPLNNLESNQFCHLTVIIFVKIWCYYLTTKFYLSFLNPSLISSKDKIINKPITNIVIAIIINLTYVFYTLISFNSKVKNMFETTKCVLPITHIFLKVIYVIFINESFYQ